MKVTKKNTAKKHIDQDLFVAVCKAELSVEVIREWRFHPVRKWRFDYAILDHKIAIEVEGGVFTQGRHTRPQGFLGDVEKYNAATLLGWRIFRVTPSELLKSKTLEMLKNAMNCNG